MDERVIVTSEPLNAETRLELQAGPLTPAPRHYVRSHFTFSERAEAILIGGAVARPRTVALDEVLALPSRTTAVTLECAGNGRSFLDPPAPGEQWRLGAVGTAEWTGVALRSLLEPAGLSAGTVEILFRGADSGAVKDAGGVIAFERSLPLSRALADDVLVAYAMNGAPIPDEHGAPVRLIVPGWYGMASVKWLAQIIALEAPFRGFFQAARYVVGEEPLRSIKPRAVIVAPLADVRSAPLTVRGYAWSGQGGIARVELSTDGGATWREAALGPERSTAAWREWRTDWTPAPGTYDLLARGTDRSGETQGLEQRRTALGYMNNAAQRVHVVVR